MRVLKWIAERCTGKARAADTAIGHVPEYADLEWQGLEGFSGEKYRQISGVDSSEWRRELKFQDELLKALGARLPRELADRRQVLERSFS